MANPNEHTLTSTAVTLEETTRRALHVLFVERLDAESETEQGRDRATREVEARREGVRAPRRARSDDESRRRCEAIVPRQPPVPRPALRAPRLVPRVVGHREADDQVPRLPDPPRDEARQGRPRCRGPDAVRGSARRAAAMRFLSEEIACMREMVHGSFDDGERFARDAVLAIATGQAKAANEEIYNLDYLFRTMERSFALFDDPNHFDDLLPQYHVLVDPSKRLHADVAKIMI